jgi:hypothetical protein
MSMIFFKQQRTIDWLVLFPLFWQWEGKIEFLVFHEILMKLSRSRINSDNPRINLNDHDWALLLFSFLYIRTGDG